MKLIVGLGNPGKQYEKTRHNIGFMALDQLAGQEKWSEDKNGRALYLKTAISGQAVHLLKPQTFMNESGVAVAGAIKNHNLAAADTIIIHDDKDLPLGKIKIQAGAGAAGHNGVQSIINHLKTKDFIRIRIGIASDNPKKMTNTTKFVLQKFGLLEKNKVSAAINRINQAVNTILSDDLKKAMNEYNQNM